MEEEEMMDSLYKRFRKECRIALSAAFCSALLAGCGENKEGQVQAPTDQVIAHVGNEEITRQELENEFRWADVPADKWGDDATVKRVMDELVVRKYLKRLALAAHLDRVPTVVLDIQRSREQMLANDYVQRNALAKIATIRPGEVYRYIDSHPAKFSKREFLTVDQISLSLAAYTQSVVDATKDLKSMIEVDQKLIAMGIIHTSSVGVLNSGDLPEELFKALHAKNGRDVFFVRAGLNGVFFEVKSEEASPLEGQAAVRLAQQLLRAEILKKEIEDAAIAANTAQVKYEGKYATIMGAREQKAEPGEKTEP
jgi:EpsD family peptidyl-prolyl cis-trans isomerase